MATIQDYREARRTGQISLTNLIARNIAEGEGFGSVGKAISQKIKARGTRIKEAFDPLNIASMLVGRTKLGTAILGRMMGRSAEDIQYFARKGAGRDAAYDPFFARSPRSLQPVRQNESMADIYAKLYALIKKQIEEENKRKEVNENFREEREMEDERRHKQLLMAIRGKGKGKATPVKEGGGFFDFVRGMLSDFKNFAKQLKDGLVWLFTAMKPIIDMLGKGLVAILKALVEGGSWLLRALLSPVGMAAAIGSLIIGAYMALSDAEIKRLKEAGGKEAEELGGERQTEEYLGAGDPGALGSAIMDASEGKKTKTDLIKEAIEKKQKVIEKLMKEQGYEKTGKDKNGVFIFQNPKTKQKPPLELMVETNFRADEILEGKKPSAKPVDEGSSSLSVPKIFQPEPEATPSTSPEKSSVTPVSSVAPGAASEMSGGSTSIATPAPSLPATPPVVTVTGQNMELESESMYSMQSAPMIFNKSSTNGVNLGGQDSGTVTGAASVRDDTLENIINKLQRRSSVM